MRRRSRLGRGPRRGRWERLALEVFKQGEILRAGEGLLRRVEAEQLLRQASDGISVVEIPNGRQRRVQMQREIRVQRILLVQGTDPRTDFAAHVDHPAERGVDAWAAAAGPGT